MTLADILIPLAGSISNEKALKMREACDMQERRVEALEKRVEALSLDVAILVEGTVEAVHEAGLRTLAQRVEALEQIRISHEADYSKSASVFADRIEALDRALSAAAEDNGDLDVRVPALERASAKNTVEGHGVAGSTPAGPSRSTTMPSTASPWDAYLEVMNAGHPGVSYRDIQRLAVDAAVRAMKNTGEGRAEGARSDDVAGPSTQPVQASPTGVREGVSVVDEGPVASRQAAPSPASPSPDEVEALARELQRAWHAGSGGPASEWSGGYLAEARYVLSRYEPRGAGAGAPTTAPPLPGGEGVPLKVAESFSKPGDYIVWRGIRGIATFHGPDAKANAETFASRAPRPVSVEEMAERLRVARNAWAGYAPGVVISPSDCWLALDRAAIGGGK